MKRLTVVIVFAVAMLLLAPLANAACPAGGASPATILSGPGWAFKAQGVGSTSYVSAGVFTATPDAATGTSRTGTLRITATTNFNGIVTRQEVDTGRYEVYPDCSGVVLSFYLSTRPINYEGWFLEGSTEIDMVSIDSNLAVVGDASRI